MAKIDAIGGSYPKSSQATMGKAAGAGTTDPYGGFMFLSATVGCASTAADASLAGISSRWVESTYGLMQSYFGAGNFTSGYRFHPVVVHILCFSDRICSAGEYADAVDASLGFMAKAISFRTCSSYVIFTPLMLENLAAGNSLASWTSLSEATVTVQIGGFIISAPTG